ncbi:unnamed protein product [Prunus brigantina]
MSLQQEHKSSIDLVFCKIYGYSMIWFSAESQFNSVSPTGIRVTGKFPFLEKL